MKKFFFSDPHFGHFNIINLAKRPFLWKQEGDSLVWENYQVEISKEYPIEDQIKFYSLQTMHEVLIQKWNNKVSPEDLVYVDGDFSYKSRTSMKVFLDRLNGKKILIKGNHDKGSIEKFLAAGFSEVHDKLELNIHGYDVVLNHYPYLHKEFNEAARRNNKILFSKEVEKNPAVPKKFDYHQKLQWLKDHINKQINPRLEGSEDLVKFMNQLINYHITNKLVNEGKILIHGHTHSNRRMVGNMINLSVEAWDYEPVSSEELIPYLKYCKSLFDPDTVNEFNYDGKDYKIITAIDLPEVKAIKEKISLYNSKKLGLGLNSSKQVPKNYSKHWYDLAVDLGYFIPKYKLKDKTFYKGTCRNGKIAYYQNNKFYILRKKFNSEFLEPVDLIEDNHEYDVFIPYNKILTFRIRNKKLLKIALKFINWFYNKP